MYRVTYSYRDYYNWNETSIDFKNQKEVIEWLSELAAKQVLGTDESYNSPTEITEIRKLGDENLVGKIKASPKLTTEFVKKAESKKKALAAIEKRKKSIQRNKNRAEKEKRDKAKLKKLAEKYPEVLK